VQLSLSTATPSLGGALPKLKTLKLGYEIPYNERHVVQMQSASRSMSFGSSMFDEIKSSVLNRAKLNLFSSSNEEDGNQYDLPNTINVLATKTEASMSSTSFAIPRRSTIDADVSFIFFFSSFDIQTSFFTGQTT
jgi:hypothetical protein